MINGPDGSGEIPPDQYKDDPGWTESRERKGENIFDDYNNKRITREQAIHQIAELIEETDAAVRASPGGNFKPVVSTSVFLQQLLYSHYRLQQKRD